MKKKSISKAVVCLLTFLCLLLFIPLKTAKAEVYGDAEKEKILVGKRQQTTSVPEKKPKKIVRVRINAVGDVTLGVNQKQTYAGSFDEYYDIYGADHFLQSVKHIFEEDDFTIMNLEGTLTDSDTIRTTKQWNHKGRPEYASILSEASVEAVSLGNNHIMDYGKEGVADTIRYITEAGLEYAISGTWGDHYGIYTTESGITIGFVSVNEYYEGNAVYRFLEDGQKVLRESGADLVFACIHWGGDKVYEPETEQYEMGHWCIDQGYDLVLGCHPHVIQGIECYQGKYVVYSMGNFCYGGNKNPSDKNSMIFQQDFIFVDGVCENAENIRAIPCSLSSVTWKNDFCPRILTGEEAEQWVSCLNAYSAEFGLVFDTQGYLIKK